jgi:HK97 gp10 family phage protein
MPKNTIKFSGVAEMCAALSGLREEIRASILSKAVDAGAIPIVTAAKRMAPVLSGSLRESITHVVKVNKENGTAYSIIGPDRGYYVNGAALSGAAKKFRGALGADKPANYAHLVEYGHATAKHGSNLRKGVGASNGTVPAKPFLRPAVMMGADAAAEAMAQSIDHSLTNSKALARVVTA